MNRYTVKRKSSFFAKSLKWIFIVIVVIAGANNFEIIKQYYLFIALAGLILLLVK
jgi:hypothetical protein